MNDMPIRHFDQARKQVLQTLETLLQRESIERAVFSPDIFARIRVVLWYAPSAEPSSDIEGRLAAAAGPFWGGLWVAANGETTADRQMLDALWEEGVSYDADNTIRVNERHRSLSVWLKHPPTPPWEVDRTAASPPIVSFYAFKGGTGRSTALAIFAAQRAQVGERVVVVDLDLSAPGVGILLSESAAVQFGVVDYWLEQPLVGQSLDLRDYYYRVGNPDVIGTGAILVFPAGRLDASYPVKLSRLDFTPPTEGKHPLETLLLQIRAQLRPDWILLDARAGISEAAGFALGGLAHLNLLFGGTSDASWAGLRLAVRRLGAARAERNLPQEDCLLIHSMVPANPQTAALARREFLRRAVEIFEQEYYLPDPDDPDEDTFWYLRDMDSRDAPHVPVSLLYSEQIAFFTNLVELTRYGLQAQDYRELERRIVARFHE